MSDSPENTVKRFNPRKFKEAEKKADMVLSLSHNLIEGSNAFLGIATNIMTLARELALDLKEWEGNLALRESRELLLEFKKFVESSEKECTGDEDCEHCLGQDLIVNLDAFLQRTK